MEMTALEPAAEGVFRLPAAGAMAVPVLLHASAALIRAMDDKVLEQIRNVACLPGIAGAAHAMPDAHWGYGFPIGGVAAFDPDQGGVVSAGGVGFDISCGVRLLRTGLACADVAPRAFELLADDLFRTIPSGIGSTGGIRLDRRRMDRMLEGGARFAVEEGYGETADLERVEEQGCMAGADPEQISPKARQRQQDQLGTLGSGNHYLEVQRVAAVEDAGLAGQYGLALDDLVVSIHCGSRGLGHQIGTEFLAVMVSAAPRHGIHLPDRELACAPARSRLGRAYLGAMRAAINCALANRQVLTHLTREVFRRRLPAARLALLYDVSHNTCKEERHVVDGVERTLLVHRKGATRAFPPGHPDLPPAFAAAGQPVLIGGTMGTASYVLAGLGRAGAAAGAVPAAAAMNAAFGSACHGAGRAMSRHQALKNYSGAEILKQLAARGILVRAHSRRGVAEEAPGAYKDVTAVVRAAEVAGLARAVLRLEPVLCIKG